MTLVTSSSGRNPAGMCDMVALFAPSLIKLVISSKKSPNGSILLFTFGGIQQFALTQTHQVHLL